MIAAVAVVLIVLALACIGWGVESMRRSAGPPGLAPEPRPEPLSDVDRAIMAFNTAMAVHARSLGDRIAIALTEIAQALNVRLGDDEPLVNVPERPDFRYPGEPVRDHIQPLRDQILRVVHSDDMMGATTAMAHIVDAGLSLDRAYDLAMAGAPPHTWLQTLMVAQKWDSPPSVSWVPRVWGATPETKGWDGTRPTAEEQDAAAMALMSLAVRDAVPDLVRAAKVLMDARDAALVDLAHLRTLGQTKDPDESARGPRAAGSSTIFNG